MPSAVDAALAALSLALQGVGEGWYLFGAQAALLRGSRRLTADIDVTLLLGDVGTHEIVQRLIANGMSLRVPDVGDFVAQTRVLPLVHEASGMPIDVVLGGPGLEQLFLEAAEPVAVGALTIPVATAEHLVVMKLLAAREKDLEDAVAIVRANALDLDAVRPLVDAIAEGLGEDDIRRAWTEVADRLVE